MTDSGGVEERQARRGPEEIELIDTSSRITGIDEHDESVVKKRSRIIEVGIALIVVATSLWWLSGSSPREAQPATPSTTSPPSAVEGDVPHLDDSDAQLAPLGDRQVLTIVSDRAGNENHLVAIGAGSTEVFELPALSNFAFDPSGRWLAATSISRLTEVREILWVAPVGGVFEPVAVDVRGFAWHDREPGRLAWTAEERTSIYELDLEEANGFAEESELELPIRGALRGWGTWGFSVQTSFRNVGSAIVSPDGDLIADELPGVYAGLWHDGRLLFSGGDATSNFVDTATWEFTPVPFLDQDDYVWTLAASEAETVVLVGEGGVRGAPFDGSVVRSEDGDTSSTAATASAYTRLAWLDDAVVFADQQVLPDSGDGGGATLTLLTGDDERFELPLPAPFDEQVWIASIAVPNDTGA